MENSTKVATSNAMIDEMVKNYINDFYGKPENELVLSKVNEYLKLVHKLITTTNRDFENDLLAIMSNNLFYVSSYMITLYNWHIFPMAEDYDLKMVFENKVHEFLEIIKEAIKTYVTERDKFIEGVANK